MAYEIVVREGILNVTFSGYVDEAEMKAYFAQVQPFIDAATEAHSVHFLIDVQRLDKISSGARKYLITQFRTSDIRVGKTAVIGSGRYMRTFGSFILQVVGERGQVRFFDSREQAMAWLKE